MTQLVTSILLLLIATVATTLQCTGTGVAGGGTIETTNGIVGVILTGDKVPSPDAVVTLFPCEYDPVTDKLHNRTIIDTTDVLGTYHFNRLEPGRYTIVARNHQTSTGSLNNDIIVDSSSVTSVPAATLHTTGSISIDLSSSNIASGNYIYIPGTDIASPVGSDGLVQLDDVPPCELSSVIIAFDKNNKQNLLRDAITIHAGDTTAIENPLWKHRTRLYFTTTTSGAAIAGTVFNFPVLIRLDENNFDFSQANPDGSDLVFTGAANGRALSHEIEYWDTATKRGVLWVRTDTILGNNNTQYIQMYWGNPTAATARNNGVVFDTAAGFQGVWHLGDRIDAPAFDATGNRYHGTSPDTACPQTTEGIIGNGKLFDGIDDYISMPNTATSKLDFPAGGTYTISAWVKLTAFDDLPHLIVAKGYAQYFLRQTYFPVDAPLWEFVEFSKTDTWEACTTTAAGGNWVLLTGVSNGEKQILYYNGVAVDSTPNNYPAGTYSGGTSHDLSIGKFLEAVNLQNNTSGYCFFKGYIDEVRILDTVQNSDWIRLCYMNQRSDERLVVYK